MIAAEGLDTSLFVLKTGQNHRPWKFQRFWLRRFQLGDIKRREMEGIDFRVCDIQSDALKEQYNVIVMTEVLKFLHEIWNFI